MVSFNHPSYIPLRRNEYQKVERCGFVFAVVIYLLYLGVYSVSAWDSGEHS